MTSEEAQSSIAALNAALRNSGFDWVLREVSVAVERGKEERSEVSFESFDAADQPIHRRGGRKTEVTTTRPLTDIEELLLLVSAIRAAIIDGSEIQIDTLRSFKEAGVENPIISFQPDVPEGFADKGYSVEDAGRGRAFEVNLGQIEDRRGVVGKLKHLIEALEGKINAD